MRSTLAILVLGLAFALPATAQAQPSVASIPDQTLNAGTMLDVNVVALDPDGASITLTGSLPAFATLNSPTSGDGQVVTTISLAPTTGDVGSVAASVTATAGEMSDTEDFQITVAEEGSDQPPRVTAPALMTTTEGSTLSFEVTASDPDEDAITGLAASDMPTGASFSTSDPFTSGTFSWTPDLSQAGQYDVTFVATNALTDSAVTHISVADLVMTPVALAPIDDVTLEEGQTATVDVIATDPDLEAMTLTASLPPFAMLNEPTSSSDTDTLATTITIAPGAGTAGTYDAEVTATSGEDIATEPFTITVTPAELAASASMIGAFNQHKKFLCWKVVPVDGSFDLLDVDLSTITMHSGEGSISSVRPTHLALDCDGDDDGGYEGDHDAALLAASDGGDGECDECDSTDCEDGPHIMACFSMSDLVGLFGSENLPGGFASATIEGSLHDGQMFVATMGGTVHVPPGQDNGHDGNGEGEKGKGKMHLFVRPNPMNPKADIVFTLSQPGQVRVAVYDLRGRLVSTVLNGNLEAGAHSIPWDGSLSSGGHAASGIYYVRVQTTQESQVQAVTVLK
jgi:hypothetical protein